MKQIRKILLICHSGLKKQIFTYLGITVTKEKHKKLFKENLTPLLNQVKRSLTKWSPLSMSLVGRINSIKMTILPKFLYIFQVLPIFIPNMFFNELDSILSSYIWQGKRPGLTNYIFKSQKRRGALPSPISVFIIGLPTLDALCSDIFTIT